MIPAGTRVSLALSLVLSSFSFVQAADLPILSPAEGATLHGMAATIEMLDAFLGEQETCALAPGVLHSMVEVQRSLPAGNRNAVVLQDGWTRPLHAWCGDGHWALISFGADGEPGSDYAGLPELGETGDDIVVIDGRFGAAPAHILAMERSGKQRRTMADIRSIATTFEAFRIDNHALPGGVVSVMEPVVGLLPEVQPIYIRTLPLIDAWGNALLYWTDGSSYRIVSAGEDGLLETDYTSMPGSGGFDYENFGRDIVFGDGEFEQWPTNPAAD